MVKIGSPIVVRWSMRGVWVGFAFLVASVANAAMPVMPQKIPGDRLVKNLEAMLAKNPKSGEIEYLIGRAHYATYATTYENGYLKPGDVEYMPGYRGSLPGFPGMFGLIRPWDENSVPKPTASNLEHIRGAVKHLRASINLGYKEDASLPHLTLACVFESAAPIADKVTLLPPYAKLKTKAQFLSEAADEYLRAYDMSIKVDETQKTIPLFGLHTLVSFEAARSYLRVRPEGPRKADLSAALAKFNKLPNSGIVTPLIFGIDQSSSLADLLDPSREVAFDLNGTGLPQRYLWVKPTTAFLVWDPEGEGKISTGRRLFGNATWWMLWSDAYQALAALDNNHDGWLSGSELKGLAIWIDRNQNGRSDPGEVVSLSSVGIEAIATGYTDRFGLSMGNPSGLRMRDGRILPTYDWVTRPLAGKREEPPVRTEK
jgi:hypothetical protein